MFRTTKNPLTAKYTMMDMKIPICENVKRADRLISNSSDFRCEGLFTLSELTTANVLSRLYSGGNREGHHLDTLQHWSAIHFT